MTGILPIKKYGTHSALNMFDEFSMTNPGPLAEYVGCLLYTSDKHIIHQQKVRKIKKPEIEMLHFSIQNFSQD